MSPKKNHSRLYKDLLRRPVGPDDGGQLPLTADAREAGRVAEGHRDAVGEEELEKRFQVFVGWQHFEIGRLSCFSDAGCHFYR